MNDILQAVIDINAKMQTLEIQACQTRDLYMELLHRHSIIQGIVDQLPQGILISNAFTAKFANKMLAEIFGFHNPSEIVSMESVETLFSTQARPIVESHFQAVMEGRLESLSFELEGTRRDGAAIWLKCDCSSGMWGNEKVTVSTVQPFETPIHPN